MQVESLLAKLPGKPTKLLGLTSEFNKTSGYKDNPQISIAFLYTKDETSEEEIKQAVPFTIAPKPILRNKFNQESEKSVQENYKTLLRAIGENKQIERKPVFVDQN